MNVLIAGGSGLIGTHLTRALLEDNHKVWVLTRRPERANLPQGAQALGWDGKTPQGWGERLNEMDAVINLAGATIGKWPWTPARKREIVSSRLEAGQALTAAFQSAKKKPKVFLQSSGINYYGLYGSQPVDESALPGDDFLSRLSQDWEASTLPLETLGVRRVILRTSVVLDVQGGVLPLMALPVKLFVGGPLGNGKQGMPWIHIADQVGAIQFLLHNEKARGPFNLCAPEPISNAEFMRGLASALKRPYWLPAPAFALRLGLGEMSVLLLGGRYVKPENLLRLGYQFKYPGLPEALKNIYS